MNNVTGLFGTIKKGFTNLTKREQVMIYGLVIVAVLGILIFLIILPAMTHMSELSDEVSKYETEDMEMRMVISQADSFDQQEKSATKSFNALKKQFYMPMDPESLDETITALVVRSGLSPKNLQMTTLQQGQIPAYAEQPLASAGIAEATTGAATGSAADMSSDSGTDGTSDANTSGGAEAYIYTVSVSAEGDKSQMSKLIDTVNATSGIELRTYSYSLSSDSTEEGTVVMGGIVNMEFYVYVYVDNSSGTAYEPIGTEE